MLDRSKRKGAAPGQEHQTRYPGNMRNLVTSEHTQTSKEDGKETQYQNIFSGSAPITPLSVAHLLDFEVRLKASLENDEAEERGLSKDIMDYVCEQAAVRVVHSTKILDEFPVELREQSHIQDLRKHYQDCITKLQKIEGEEDSGEAENSKLTKIERIAEIVDKAARGKRLGFDMMCIARAIRVLSRRKGPDAYFGSELQRDIDRVVHSFNNMRIGVRLLSDMYTRASKMKETSPFSAVGRGILHRNVSIHDEVERATAFVESIAVENLYMCPEMNITNSGESHVPYVPSHVWYIVVEILKNAVVAVVDQHGNGEGTVASRARGLRLPPIDVNIESTKERTIIEVADLGGGLGPASSVGKAMAYCFTTGTRPAGNDLSGAGIGLPMAHAYAEYFGGSLGFKSSDDGCVVRVALTHSDTSKEPGTGWGGRDFE
eukprot:g1719.t1